MCALVAPKIAYFTFHQEYSWTLTISRVHPDVLGACHCIPTMCSCLSCWVVIFQQVLEAVTFLPKSLFLLHNS